MKKTLRLALIITSAILLIIAAAVASSASDDDVLFLVWKDGKEQYEPFAVKGEIALGENTVTVNDGCWKFTAEKAGYYGYDYSDEESQSSMEIAVLKNGKADTVYTENMSGLCFDWVENGENGYYVFYLETPGTYYIRFSSAASLYRDKEAVPSTDVISFVYFGELESLEISKDPLYIETDICLWWREEESTLCCFGEDVEQWLTFTNGRYKTGLIGSVDKWESGKRIFTYNLGNGPEMSKELTLVGITDTLESISFPEGFNPVIKFNYKAADSQDPFSQIGRDCAFSEWTQLNFTDGSSVKAITDNEEHVSYDKFAYFKDDEGREHWVLMQYLWLDDGIHFSAKVDGVTVSDSKAKTNSDVFGAYMNHLSSCVFFFRQFAGEMIYSPASAISSLSNNLREEYREFSEYIKNAKRF